ERQLAGLAGGDPLLAQIYKRIGIIDQYFRSWTGVGFDPSQIATKVSPDSQISLERFKEDRKVLCPDGQWRVFSWHVRITPRAWGLYFEPDPASRKAWIGYIGRNPPSVSDPT